MASVNYPDPLIKSILRSVKTIAMVGASANEIRPSYFAMMYLLNKGYKIVPVNPGAAGKEILGQKVYASVKEVPAPVDMVDIFREAKYAPAIVREALENAMQADRPDDLLSAIENISAGIPDERWAELPADLSDNLDHYVYGISKH